MGTDKKLEIQKVNLPKKLYQKSITDLTWDTTLVEPKNYLPCYKEDTRPMTFYIKSHYQNGTERRKFIRETWGSSQNLFFIVSRNSIDNNKEPTESEPFDAKNEDMLILENME